MHVPLGAIVVAALTSLILVAPTAAEEELYAGDYVDRESVPGVTHEILAADWLEYGDDHLMHVRTTLEPGAGIPASVFSDYWASTVESGELTVVALEGGLARRKRGPRQVFEAGSTLYATSDDVLRWENRSLLPAEVLSAILFDQDRDPITRAEDFPSFEQAFKGDVVKRVVLKGTNNYDEPWRVVVRDRSGQLLDARMPTARESDWAWAGTPYREDVAFVAGPPYLPGSRLMVGWMSFPCGPDAIIDLGQDLRAIQVIDRYRGGCDSSGEWHDVALTVRSGDAIEGEEILGRVIRQ